MPAHPVEVLAKTLEHHGITPERAEVMSDRSWWKAADYANLRRCPSRGIRARVVELMVLHRSDVPS